MSLFINGLVTGLDTSEIIRQLMAAERIPLTKMEARQATFDKRVDAWGKIGSSLASLDTAINSILTPLKYDLFAATSSNETILKANATIGATPGSTTFRVQSLAAAHQIMSQGFDSADAVVGQGTVTAGSISQLGFSAARGSVDLAAGAHTLEVVQATTPATAAKITGSLISTPVTITGSNRTLDITVNGSARAVAIANGTYNTLSDLATAVNTAIGADVTVSVNGSALEITTNTTGSTSALQITGGNSLATLGFSVMGAPNTGTDAAQAQIKLDGVTTSFASLTVGQQITVNSTTGSLLLTVGSVPLTPGSTEVTISHTGSGTTLTQLADQLKAQGMNAQVINAGTGPTPYHLVISAAETGTANALTIDTQSLGFTEPFTTLRAAADAQITMGGLTIVRPTNTISDFLPGVTIDLLKAEPLTDVTVTVGRDAEAVTEKVKAFVDSLNSLINTVKGHTAQNFSQDGDSEKAAGVLAGDGGARRLLDQLADAMWYSGTGAFSRLSEIGITRGANGTYALDEEELTDALAADFDGVVDLLARDTTVPSEGVLGTLLAAVDNAQAVDGLIDSSTRSAQSSSDGLETRIASYEVRLDSVEARHRRQFAALETLIGQLNNQSSWLTSQINQLPTFGN